MDETISDKISSQLEYSAYLLLTLCMISLYTCFTIYQKRKPVNELNKLKEYIDLNSDPSKLILNTRSQEALAYIENFRKTLHDSINNQCGISIDWGLFTFKHSADELILPIDREYGLSSNDKVGDIVSKLSAAKRVLHFNILGCHAYGLEKLDREQTYYYNVSDIFYSKGSESKSIGVRLAVYKKLGNTIAKTANCKVICSYSDDTVMLKSNVPSAWLKKDFPWFARNISLVKDKGLDFFDKLWEDDLIQSTLLEEQTVFGLTIRGSGLSAIIIAVVLGLLIFHLALIQELTDTKKDTVKLNWGVMFNNRWAYVMRLCIWFIVPTLSIVLNSIFISEDYKMTLWVAPVAVFGLLIINKAENLLKKVS